MLAGPYTVGQIIMEAGHVEEKTVHLILDRKQKGKDWNQVHSS
jgi:hypothetical protein